MQHFSLHSLIYLLGIAVTCVASETAPPLPVNPPDANMIEQGIRNPLTFQQIRNIVGGARDGSGLDIDLEDESIFGTIYSGPYPFEADESDYDIMRFRLKAPLDQGKGTIPCADFFKKDKINANNWPKDHMTIAYRLELYQRQINGGVRPLGFYDSIVSFRQTKRGIMRRYAVRPSLTIIEGPFVNQLNSQTPSKALIVWQTDKLCKCELHIIAEGVDPNAIIIGGDDIVQTAAPDQTYYQYEAQLSKLIPDTKYRYTVHCQGKRGDTAIMGPYTFQTAPTAGNGSVVFAFASDSREGVGGGEQAMMGHNAKVLKQIAQAAYRQGARFFIFGGDLVNGYTTSTHDFRLQMRGWKQSLAGFWRSSPVYPVMGNHEALLNKIDGISFDKWPYTTESAEAIFAENFWNPRNGPMPSDIRRPPYKENVYSFQYGPVLCIGYNNNYWWTTNSECASVGGSPEGYLLNDQLEWIESELLRAETDPTIRYILLYAQEPIFPCGGHVGDCMWWKGNNDLRAYTYTYQALVPEKAGMIEVRNRFWKALAQSSKVAAVLSGDEHEYHRLLVDSTTPVGVMALDDLDGNNRLDDGQISPNPEFENPVWHITAGTAGAPYYAREETPWEPVYLTSQSGYCLFKADSRGLSLTFYSITGQILDQVSDLMAIKESGR